MTNTVIESSDSTLKSIINHVRAWAASLLAFPFVILIFVISLISRLIFAVSYVLIIVPAAIYRVIGPKALNNERSRYHNIATHINQRLCDTANWPNK